MKKQQQVTIIELTYCPVMGLQYKYVIVPFTNIKKK